MLTGRPLSSVLTLLFLLCAFAPSASAATPSKDTLQSVSESLTCQCGCGLTVANCNHPQCEFSVPVRDQIETMLKQGISGAQIIATFRHKYGEKILSAPTTQGFNLLAWIMPFAALAAGCGIIFAFADRWYRRGLAEATARQETPEGGFDSELRRRLERELKEQI